jgi:nucleotide-binding universal stress UspA family protein
MTEPSPSPVILAGIDGGPGSAAVLRSAAALAAVAGGAVVIAHVVAVPQLPSSGVPACDDPSSLSDVEADLFPDVVEAMLETSVTWKLVTTSGTPAAELIRLSRAEQAAAIVVGADTPGWASHLRRFSVGSVPSRLAHEQALPVVIVPRGCSRRRDPRHEEQGFASN